MDERARRIVKTAVKLAERDGFSAVRLRDVAAQAGVALGTVYRRFPNKESILVAALALESKRLQKALSATMPVSSTAFERVSAFFTIATRGLLSKPHLARALLRSVASADPEITPRVAGFHTMINRFITAAVRGEISQMSTDAELETPVAAHTPLVDLDDLEATIGFTLQQVWFASLVGWASGMHDESMVVRYVEATANLLLEGIDRP